MTNLGIRMKSYEDTFRYYLPPRMPFILRLDGCHFHSFTKEFKKPYDQTFVQTMRDVLIKLCEQVQGTKFGYTTSDEFSLLICDTDNLETTPWFGKSIQKMTSVAASLATYYFHQFFIKNMYKYADEYHSAHQNAFYNQIGVFDCRAFVLPKDEIVNYFYWREAESIRNSISSLAQVHFSQKELNQKSGHAMCEMLHSIGHDWEATPLAYQRGVSAIKRVIPIEGTNIERHKWIIDDKIPIFYKEPRYILNEFEGGNIDGSKCMPF